MPDAILFRYRDEDTPTGASRKSTLEAAKRRGMNETQFIHHALVRLITDGGAPQAGNAGAADTTDKNSKG